ncbi:hypothetical protein NFI96_010205, partial [Prochilodus magdalenae]
MASECTQESVLPIPTEPGKKAAAKEAFKGYVDSVAVVKVDNGEKYVCLKKKFRGRQGCGTAGPGVSGSASTSPATGATESPGAEMGICASKKRPDKDAGSRTLEDIPETIVAEVCPHRLDSRPDQIVPLKSTSNHGTQKSLQGRSQRRDHTADEAHMDMALGSDINTPKGSRKNFLEHMMSSSPQVRRSMALRNSVYVSNRYKDAAARSEVDAAFLHSGAVDEENATVALEPLEHEWMMCASDGEWESLQRLLSTEPGLVCKKDFVTGFTCLHWAAKLGKAELLVLLVRFATQRGVPVDVNARSSAGYTPLHLAAMHNHMEVVKLLIGAYDADVDARDYSGKKASQYLKGEVARDVLDIVGAGTEVDAHGTDAAEGSGWRLSKVLQANLRPLKLLHHSTSEDDVSAAAENAGLVREKVLRRKTSLRGLRPRLGKLRTRTQIVHSTSLSGHFD